MNKYEALTEALKRAAAAARIDAAPGPGTTGPAPGAMPPQIAAGTAPTPPRIAAADPAPGPNRTGRNATPRAAHAGQAERNRQTPGPADRRPEPSPPAGDRPTVAPGPGEIGPRTGPRQNAQKPPLETV